MIDESVRRLVASDGVDDVEELGVRVHPPVVDRDGRRRIVVPVNYLGYFYYIVA